jgi:hypothetical protein
MESERLNTLAQTVEIVGEGSGPQLLTLDAAIAFPAPAIRTHRAHTGRPRLANSSTSRTAPSTSSAATPWVRAWMARSSPTNATGRASGIVSTSTSPGRACAIAAWTIRLSCWPQRTGLAGPAARPPATI